MYCPRCSKTLEFDAKRLTWYCPECKFNGIPETKVKMNKGSPCVC